MNTRKDSSRNSRPQDEKPQRPDQDAATQEPPMRFTDQDQELAADTIVRSDNPSAP